MLDKLLAACAAGEHEHRTETCRGIKIIANIAILSLMRYTRFVQDVGAQHCSLVST